MKTVWKFAVPIEDHFTIEMPAGAELLHVDWQLQGAQLWAMVDEGAPPEPRRFRLAGTGHKLPDFRPSWKFVGTFFLRLPSAPLVFHLWEVQ